MERSEQNECSVSEEPNFMSGNHERTGSLGSDPPAGPGRRLRRLRPPEQVNGRLVDSGAVDKRAQRLTLTMLTSAVLSAVAMATETHLFNLEHI